MAISRLQASLAAATSEVTLAAANINFDFTLVKYEAPKEYQALGMNLSAKRKQNAEYGQSHITARKLGALFEGVCPAAPNLIAAYGTRASETAKASQEMSEPYKDTVFNQYTGIDGTSIWAAATSSNPAIHVHLLACMLARMWTAQEAVAIWVEIVAERRKQVAKQLEDGDMVNFALAAAAAQEIARSDLASLDASARAWLRTADMVHQLKQKQLELILKNLKLSIGGNSKVFSDVILAWSTAVKTMDRLVAGIPQETQNGAVLLGISAWHIYPDMRVFSPKIVPVDMNDRLVDKGGVLSLGLSPTPHTTNNNDDNGVFWSLSLAHLRSYGPPVPTSGVVGSGPRITFSQLTLVFYVCLLRFWEFDPKHDTALSKFMLHLYDLASRPLPQNTLPWKKHLLILKNGASAYLDSTETEDQKQKLIMLATRRAKSFLDDANSFTHGVGDLFGLLNYRTILDCLIGDNERLIFLQHLARHIQRRLKSNAMFIIEIHGKYFGVNYPAENYPEPDPIPNHHFSQGLKNSLFGGNYKSALYLIAPPEKECFQTLIDVHETLCHSNTRLEVFFQAFNLGLFDQTTLIETLCYTFDKPALGMSWSTSSQALVAMSAVSQIYEHFSDATIDVRILHTPILDTKWARFIWRDDLNHFPDLKLSPFDFSVITYMESCIDISPESLRDVVALSTDDSIYVHSTMVEDPYRSLTSVRSIQRIFGNVGKPGITFMVPPKEVMIREIDPGSWRVASYDEFDGRPSNSFKNTSAHLSFTDYQRKVHDGVHGIVDSQLLYIEPVFSVREGGNWVADLNPSIFTSASMHQLHQLFTKNCSHSMNTNGKKFATKLVVVDSWEELLDPPEGDFIVRTGGNWVARLSLMMVTYQKLEEMEEGFEVIVCPTEVCWSCVLEKEHVSNIIRRAYIF